MRTQSLEISHPLRQNVLRLALLLFSLAWLSPGAILADVWINGTICNSTTEPVLIEFFNHNDILNSTPFTETEVHPCSCKPKRLRTDLSNNMPLAKVHQLTFREVSGEGGYRFVTCVNHKGELSGYYKLLKGSGKTEREACLELEGSTSYHSAPEITHAQGDLKILETRMAPTADKCALHKKDIFGNRSSSNGCERFTATYDYDNGTNCKPKS